MLPLQDTPVERPKTQKSARSVVLRSAIQSGAVESKFSVALSNPADVIFLDVETTGLSWFYDQLTIVGWACDGTYHCLVTGDDPTALLEALRKAKALVTFNGTLFDLRFLKKAFGELQLPAVHIDLRYFARRAGLSGGQKAIEKILDLPTRVGFEDMGGAEAVVLWRKWVRGDDQALKRLVDYNRHDVFGMCGILDKVMDRLDPHPDLLFSRHRFSDVELREVDSGTQSWNVARTNGRTQKAATFDGLFTNTPAQHATVVGIDLTGSEARPSGWCVLRGASAETCTVATDEEMISRVLSERPTLVSIDSPLSIPFGRTQVEDSDPGRDKYGIMRLCERELKKRGINVYPCLLPSMQKLTKRGMRLAQTFRAAGIPVIESYPGAAQDIMGIPRKGAGEQFLKDGLVEFGIHGSYQSLDVTHDELDAITSAIVGSFFLAGQFEALRGPEEGALIIPDLKAPMQGQLVVGISGRICAGKTTIARLIEANGFAYTRFSLVIDDEIRRRGEEPNRENRQRVGAEVHEVMGQRWLCEKVLERVGNQRLVVVDGLRFPEDHSFFVETFGSAFFHLHVQSDPGIRSSRFSRTVERALSFSVVDQQPVEMEIDKLAFLADTTLRNEGTLAELGENVLSYLTTAGQRQGVCPFPSS